MAEGGQDIFCQICLFRRDVEEHVNLCLEVVRLRNLAPGPEHFPFAEILRQAEETIILSQNRDDDGYPEIYRGAQSAYDYLLAVRSTRPLTNAEQNMIPVVQITQEQVTSCKQCTICFEKFTISDQVKVLPCGHFYHVYCIVDWLGRKSSCPVCRAILNKDFEIEDLIDLDTIVRSILSRSTIQIYYARVINAQH